MTAKKIPANAKKPVKIAPKKAASKKPVKVVKKQAKKEVVPVANGKNNVVVNEPTVAAIAATSDEQVNAELRVPRFAIGAVHAEAVQAAQYGNKGFETPLVAQPDIAAQAWDLVKGADDPPLYACVPTHQEKLLAHYHAIIKGGSPLVGDTMLARFEQAVMRLKEKN